MLRESGRQQPLLTWFRDKRRRGSGSRTAQAAGPLARRRGYRDHRYYAAVKDRKDGKRAALSEARKILRQACHILTELGDDALTAA